MLAEKVIYFSQFHLLQNHLFQILACQLLLAEQGVAFSFFLFVIFFLAYDVFPLLVRT